jgi:hypothetical protein
MAFAVAHRFSGAARLSGWSVLRAGRSLATRLHTQAALTPDERANRYISRMPIAVVTASLGGHPPDGA